MNGETKHWRSCVKFILEENLVDLETAINKFCKGKFVVGIQYPFDQPNEFYKAVVSYKTLDD